jgi:hypothetical protein
VGISAASPTPTAGVLNFPNLPEGSNEHDDEKRTRICVPRQSTLHAHLRIAGRSVSGGLLLARRCTRMAWFRWHSDIDLTLHCDNPASSGTWTTAFLDLEHSIIEVDLGSDVASLKQHCPITTIRSTRKPLAVISAGQPDAPGDDKPIAAHFVPTSIGLSPSLQEAQIPTAERLKLRFVAGELLQYVGLAERDASLHLQVNLAQKNSFSTSPQHRNLQIRPPEEFYIASSPPSAVLNPNDIELCPFWAELRCITRIEPPCLLLARQTTTSVRLATPSKGPSVQPHKSRQPRNQAGLPHPPIVFAAACSSARNTIGLRCIRTVRKTG